VHLERCFGVELCGLAIITCLSLQQLYHFRSRNHTECMLAYSLHVNVKRYFVCDFSVQNNQTSLNLWVYGESNGDNSVSLLCWPSAGCSLQIKINSGFSLTYCLWYFIVPDGLYNMPWSLSSSLQNSKGLIDVKNISEYDTCFTTWLSLLCILGICLSIDKWHAMYIRNKLQISF